MSWVMKHELIITSLALNNRIWSGNTSHIQRQKSSDFRRLHVKWWCCCFGTVMGRH